ncbi:mitochondrial protein Pet127-domain-containing protein [Irpex rosettiformis]|uniref:Mitochondrial protein Pet127-domain-containing protein n=1 Tax=Irpex rosettiformis TaxID=378272 RepID=A0ACB8TWX6_9APHY|nr:mitochondrial protein Pet127-domain-containing protein [Irpex rosettiformis]
MSLARNASLTTFRAWARANVLKIHGRTISPTARSSSNSQPSDPAEHVVGSEDVVKLWDYQQKDEVVSQPSLGNLSSLLAKQDLPGNGSDTGSRSVHTDLPLNRKQRRKLRRQAMAKALSALTSDSDPHSDWVVKQAKDLIRVGKRVKREDQADRLSAAEASAILDAYGALLKPPNKDGTEERDSKVIGQGLHLDAMRGTANYLRRIEGVLMHPDGRSQLQDLDPPTEQNPVAQLSHGLDRVLFNQGVYWLQDPRSQVYNFSPWLQKIPKVQDFAFGRVQSFMPSSKDDDLHTLAKRTHSRYTGSTSSLTGMLSQIYLMLSCERPVDLSTLSSAFKKEPSSFTVGQKFPVATKLIYKDGIYSTDSFSHTPGLTDRNVLTWMGTLLEKFLTLPEEQFKLLLHSTPPPLPELTSSKRDAFRFAKVGSYVMRSQLDCYDPRLPGTGVFDIKTRAAMPIRVDLMNWEENSSYVIDRLYGRVESFEREYYDLIRSAFLKYSFQARIGNMDGVLVAYHNTARIFGFQYIPLEEMDERLYGNKDAGPLIFQRCVELLQVINDEITQHFPEQSVRCLWDAVPEQGALKIWVQPHDREATEDQPIIELEVVTTNFLDDKFTWGALIADHLSDKTWTTRYSISTSSSSQDEIRHRYQSAVEKQKHIFDLPSGVDINEMEELWEQMDFGGDDTSAVAFSPEMFREPSAMAKRTRALARRGKARLDMMAQQMLGKPVVVYGELSSSSQ